MLLSLLYAFILLMSVFIGISALTLGILAWSRSKQAYLKHFLVVLGAFTLKFLIDFLWAYIVLNIRVFTPVQFRIFLTASCTSDFLFIFFLISVWNSFLSLNLPRKAIAAAGFVLAAAFLLLLATGTYDPAAPVYRPGLPAGIGNLIAVLVFFLTIVPGFTRFAIIREQGRRFFLTRTLVRSCIGFIQMAGSLVYRFRQLPDLEIRAPLPGEIGFPLLSVYFFLFMAAVIYYFLKFQLLAASDPAAPVPAGSRKRGSGALPGDGADGPDTGNLVFPSALDRFCAQNDISARERDILSLVLEGFGNEEIGRRLFISTGTVKTHMHNIFRKTGIGSRTRLVRRILG